MKGGVTGTVAASLPLTLRQRDGNVRLKVASDIDLLRNTTNPVIPVTVA